MDYSGNQKLQDLALSQSQCLVILKSSGISLLSLLFVFSCSVMSERTIACQASLSMGFPREDYWSGVPFPSPGDLPDPQIEPVSPALAGRFFTTKPPGKVFSLCKFPYKQLQTRKGTLQNRLAIFLRISYQLGTVAWLTGPRTSHHLPLALACAVSSPDTLLLTRPWARCASPRRLVLPRFPPGALSGSGCLLSHGAFSPSFGSLASGMLITPFSWGGGSPNSHSAGGHMVEAVKEWAEAALSGVWWPWLRALLHHGICCPFIRRQVKAAWGLQTVSVPQLVLRKAKPHPMPS